MSRFINKNNIEEDWSTFRKTKSLLMTKKKGKAIACANGSHRLENGHRSEDIVKCSGSTIAVFVPSPRIGSGANQRNAML
jgi:hypothetical protein